MHSACSGNEAGQPVKACLSLALPRWDLHYVRPPKQPIQANIQPIRNLAHAVQVQGAQHAYGFKIKSAPAADADAAIDCFRFHASNQAGFDETNTKEAEVGRHSAKMVGGGIQGPWPVLASAA